ncbi:hypothetical protein SDC9_72476 [bioreactor metagenome]|uniref:Uncharacterized protein n=1 Tax=bioreactor metagenome TaxID=1076179 RepID=A0A644YBQ9_9ZZZZ
MHSRVCPRLDEGFDLVGLPLLDAVPHGGVGEEDLRAHHPAAARTGYELLGAYPHEDGGELDADLLLLVGREDVDDPVDGLGGILGVEGGEDEVPRFGGGDGRGDGLQVPHFADEDDVGVLAEHPPEGFGEAAGVDAHLALVDDGFLRFVDVFHRVFDGDHVVPPLAVDFVDEGGEGCGFAVAGGSGDEEEAPSLVGDLDEAPGQAQFLDGPNPHWDEPEGEGHVARFKEAVSPEAGFFSRRGVVGEAEVVFPALPVRCHLFGLEDVRYGLLHVLQDEGGDAGYGMELSVDPEARKMTDAEVKVACARTEDFRQ